MTLDSIQAGIFTKAYCLQPFLYGMSFEAFSKNQLLWQTIQTKEVALTAGALVSNPTNRHTKEEKEKKSQKVAAVVKVVEEVLLPAEAVADRADLQEGPENKTRIFIG